MSAALVIVIVLLALSVTGTLMGRGESVVIALWAIAVILLCSVHL